MEAIKPFNFIMSYLTYYKTMCSKLPRNNGNNKKKKKRKENCNVYHNYNYQKLYGAQEKENGIHIERE